MAPFDAKKAFEQLDPEQQAQYYKKKFGELADDYNKLVHEIDKLKQSYDLNVYKEDKYFKCQDELHLLRTLVSELKLQNLQEKENVMNLITENEKLKSELVVRNMIGNPVNGSDGSVLWAPTRPELKELVQRSVRESNTKKSSKMPAEVVKAIEQLSVLVQSIKVKTESVTDIYAAEIAFLLKDRENLLKIHTEERNGLREEIRLLQKRMQKMEAANLGDLRKFAGFKSYYIIDHHKRRRELESALSHLKLCKEIMGNTFPRFSGQASCADPAASVVAAVAKAAVKEGCDIKALNLQLKRKNSLLIKYRKKCMDLQKEIETLKNQHVQEAAAQNSRLLERLKFLQKKLEVHKKQRKFDAEGFQSD